ncbi:MAG: transferase [Xanthobacteraceae bacterium]
MRAASAPTTIRVYEPVALGDVSLAPRELTGVSQAELAQSMAAYLTASAPDSDAQALGSLRRAFPRAPLTARVAALAALIRR